MRGARPWAVGRGKGKLRRGKAGESIDQHTAERAQQTEKRAQRVRILVNASVFREPAEKRAQQVREWGNSKLSAKFQISRTLLPQGRGETNRIAYLNSFENRI